MENEDRYLEAARIVAECKPSKLPYVLAILREGGIVIDDSPAMPKLRTIKGKRDKRSEWLAEVRNAQDPVDWEKTDDETILLLREAFKSGISVTRFAEVSGIYRTAIYKHMSARNPLSDTARAKIEKGLRELGFLKTERGDE